MPAPLNATSDELVSTTALGPIYMTTGVAVAIPWSSCLMLMQELARKALDPSARVTSSIADDLAGVDAVLGLAAVQGMAIGQARQADVWSCTALAAMVVSHGERHGGQGLEGLTASLANLLWGQVPEHVACALAQTAADLSATSAYTAQWPTLVMERSGAAATYDAGQVLTFDDDWRRKLAAHTYTRKRDARLKGLLDDKKQEISDAIAGASVGTGTVGKLGEWFGPGWEEWSGIDAPFHKTSLEDYANEHGIGGLKAGAADPLSEAKRMADGTWGEEPYHREDVVDPTDMAGHPVGDGAKDFATKAADKIKDVGGWAEKLGAPKQLVEKTEMVAGSFLAGVYIGGVIVNFIDPYVDKLVHPAGGTPVPPPEAPKPADDPKRPDPNTDDGDGHVSLVWLNKQVAQAKRVGMWPRIHGPSDHDDTNGPGAVEVGHQQFTLVDPLKDPSDMLIADGSSTVTPPERLTQRGGLPSWTYVFYVGRGTATFVHQISPNKVLVTSI
ncbi:hypothetical protein BA895_20510 [Humibacillus sp. DSM 29435]|uniref:hypothetical protein n=1 Tax=Humibacillus sp. DSM 29435 TaxID=1869167 RepID=UPI000871DC65|nr:hypothetical protein [Humibacillus sp. DSM 29435]OFE16106.1 hypothetical protein BA895_20510 [Humibacillus sp. DSM 29435]